MGISSRLLTRGSAVLTGSGASGASFVLIDRTAGTNIGNMTDRGGLAVPFDGVTFGLPGDPSTTARYRDVDAWAGKTLAAPRTFGKALIYGTDGSGFESGPIGSGTDTIEIYGKNGTAPAAYNDGTLLATLSFGHVADESGGRELDSTDLSTHWDHIFAHIHSGNVGQVVEAVEIVLYAWE